MTFHSLGLMSSSQISAVAAVNLVPPSISCTAPNVVGRVVTITPGIWLGSPALTYQWALNGVDIPGATGLTYTIANEDQGLDLTAREIPNGIDADSESSNTLLIYTPLVMGQGLWLDAADLSTISSATNIQTQWRDKCGLARHFDFLTTPSAPKTGLATKNGRNVITFPDDGVAHFLRCTDSGLLSLHNNGNYTIYVIGRRAGNRSGQVIHRMYNGHIGALNSRLQFGPLSPGNAFRFGSQQTGTSAQMTITADTDYHIMRGLKNGTTAMPSYDGVDGPTAAANTTLLVEIRIGSQASGVLVDSLWGDICEIFVKPGVATTQEDSDFREYGTSKWNLP